MTSDEGVLRSVSWRDLFPWTILFRLYRVAVSLQLLLLSFVGVWATSAGWEVSRSVCLSDESRVSPAVEPFMHRVTGWPDSVYWPTNAAPTTADSKAEGISATLDEPRLAVAVESGTVSWFGDRIVELWHGWLGRTPMYAIMEPVRRWLDPSLSWDQFAFYLAGGLWSLLVWCLIGGAITRAAAVRLGRDERVGLRESLEFSSRKLLSFLGAPLLPIGAIFALGIPLFILGLLMRTNFGVAVGGLLWLPVGLIGFAMALFAIGLFFGWPLMWSAISAEGSDAFDGISRSYAYTYQRPLQYFGYFVLALFLGFLGWVIVGLFCQAILQFSLLAVGSGTGPARLEALRGTLAGAPPADSSLLWFGGGLIGFVNRCFLGLQVAFAYSFMWVAAAAIYLLLRFDADQTEMDDVYLEEDDQPRYGLPPLTVDEAGVPGTDSNADSPPEDTTTPPTDSPAS